MKLKETLNCGNVDRNFRKTLCKTLENFRQWCYTPPFAWYIFCETV